MKASFSNSRFGTGSVLDLLGDDVRRRVDLVDVHDGRLADDRDRLGDGLGAEDHPELRGLADPERERLLDRLEALEGDSRRVAGGRRNRREAGGALGGGHGRAGEAGLGALQLDRDAGKGGARLVDDVDLHRGVGGLRPRGRGPRQRRQENGPEEGHGAQEGGSGQPRHLNPPGRQRALSQKGLGPQGEYDGTYGPPASALSRRPAGSLPRIPLSKIPNTRYVFPEGILRSPREPCQGKSEEKPKCRQAG